MPERLDFYLAVIYYCNFNELLFVVDVLKYNFYHLTKQLRV